MKNNLCLFERPFKIQKNGVFLFEISFCVLEISAFFCFANLTSDRVILFATKKWCNTEETISLEILKQCS